MGLIVPATASAGYYGHSGHHGAYGHHGSYGHHGYYGHYYPSRFYGPSGQRQRGVSSEYLGALDLNVKPKDTQVYLNGNYIGVTGSFDGFPRHLWLEEGTYELMFQNDGYSTVVHEFVIRPGRMIDVRLRLAQGESVPPEKLASGETTPRSQSEETLLALGFDGPESSEVTYVTQRVPFRTVGSANSAHHLTHRSVTDTRLERGSSFGTVARTASERRSRGRSFSSARDTKSVSELEPSPDRGTVTGTVSERQSKREASGARFLASVERTQP